MLRPFKSLLTYLQKASSDSSSSSMGDYTEEVKPGDEGSEANGDDDDGLLEEEEPDPLTDPLAIDHDFSSLLMSKNITTSASSYRRNVGGEEDEEDEEDDEDDDGGTNAEIVFVDIDSLKSKRISLEVPPPVLQPATVVVVSEPTVPAVAQPDPKDGTEDRLKPGVEAPGGATTTTPTTSTTTSSTSATGEDGESRSDGSDSGLGSELLNLNAPCDTPLLLAPPLAVSILKRRPIRPEAVHNPNDYDVVDYRSALKRPSLEKNGDSGDAKKPRRNIQFENVTTFYFPRIQGFVCVPSQGGCTLGMESNHIFTKSVTLNEHLAEQRRAHRQQLEQLNPNYTRSQHSSSEDSDEEGCSDVNGSDVDTESTGFLRPVSTKQRRVLLKAAGVRKIETAEKDECRVIRTSREVCGCRCQGYCDPDLCYCSVNGIKCQVDRVNFPCNCTRESCGNAVGRVEFNPMRVRTHFIHTIMRLELEAKQRMTELETTAASSSSGLLLHGSDLTDYSRSFESRGMTLLNGGGGGGSSQFLRSINIPTMEVDDEPVDYDELLMTKSHIGDHSMLSLSKSPMTMMPDSPLDFHFAYRDEFAAAMGSVTRSSSSSNNNHLNSYDLSMVPSSSRSSSTLITHRDDNKTGGGGEVEPTTSSSCAKSLTLNLSTATTTTNPSTKDFMRNGAAGDHYSDDSGDLNTPQGPYTPTLLSARPPPLVLLSQGNSNFGHSLEEEVETPFKVAFETLKQIGLGINGSVVNDDDNGREVAVGEEEEGSSSKRTGVSDNKLSNTNGWPATATDVKISAEMAPSGPVVAGGGVVSLADERDDKNQV